MELMVKLMKVENEENALICIKIMIDGFRAHKVCGLIHEARQSQQADKCRSKRSHSLSHSWIW